MLHFDTSFCSVSGTQAVALRSLFIYIYTIIIIILKHDALSWKVINVFGYVSLSSIDVYIGLLFLAHECLWGLKTVIMAKIHNWDLFVNYIKSKHHSLSSSFPVSRVPIMRNPFLTSPSPPPPPTLCLWEKLRAFRSPIYCTYVKIRV